MKVGRNEVCPCGSGKKYKKCCINSDNELPDTFSNYLKTHNSVELLKVFSLIQLLPINQSKILRLETIQNLICSNLNNISGKINYNAVKSLIQKDYTHDYREDPAESCATENIMFFNGNNIVFPGIAKDSAPINQLILNTIFALPNALNDKTKKTIHEGVFFMLYIHDVIAKKLGLSRYLYEDDWRGNIYFPSENFININKEIFEFSEEDVKYIYRTLGIEEDVIQYFYTTKEELLRNKNEDTLLIEKPFIKFNNKYILVLPSTQMYSVNIFIRKVLKLNGEQKTFNKYYKAMVLNESQKYLHAKWQRENLKTKLEDTESIWRLDYNKLAYVRYIDSSKESDIQKRANRIITDIRKELKRDDIEFLVVLFFASYELDMHNLYMFENIKESKYQLGISFFDFERFYNQWEPDKLTLWKYAKAEKRAEEHNIRISPNFSILTYFQWYKKNNDSFFPSDDTTPNFISFDYTIQAKIIAESTQKSDKHFVMHIKENLQRRFLPVIKTKEYAPIYISEEIFGGKYRIVLEKFSFPIWFSYRDRIGSLGKNFIEAITYWLNEFSGTLNPYFSILGNYPVEFVVHFDEKMKEISTSGIELKDNSEVNIEYSIAKDSRRISLKIPIEIFSALHRSDNFGESLLMKTIIESLNELSGLDKTKFFTVDEIDEFIKQQMPLSRRKMLLTSHQEDDFKRFDMYIPSVRFVQDADIAIVLENNVQWLNYPEKIPEKVKDENKIELLYDIVDSLTNQLQQRIKQYDSNELIVFLMLRHEAVIQRFSMWDMNLAAKIECFSKYEDVIDDYKEEYGKIVSTSHALRSLIEYVFAELPSGSKKINDDDIDFLLALVSEIIFYGSVKDSIHQRLDNPDIGLLPSGRIGMNHDFHDTIVTEYRESTILDEIHNNVEDFENQFESEELPIITDPKKNEYYDRVDNIFEEELGIAIYKISDIATFLTRFCFQNENSYCICDENDLVQLIKDNSNLTEKEILAFIEFLSLESRGGINVAPVGLDIKETWVWRFNRRISYIRRPLLKFKNNDSQTQFLWSARHLIMAADNLRALFHNGTLKVEEDKYPKITSLIKERTIIKGKEYRAKVLSWLKTTSLHIIEHEVKIRPSVFPNADKDYGDIDILAVDLNKKKVYLIECKNTKQVKILYDFQNDARNYIDKQLPKHLNRGNFITANLNQLSNKIGIDVNDYEVLPIVISSYQLPIKFLQSLPIPIYSFTQIKREKVFL
ncbi:hypothetical protein GGR22_000732 [Flavobacterium gossypii]|uniref:SEC-C domain-containing protein n=1 Tax=Flavobacterium gossypii TaxID=1646119 RepID=A0ABR6DMT9_9FLAO|nr:SEC-C metal-binding domain-containing protein [Flavobacterium gossypii]MBA9072606.1 hypothetical protein [Flavobacterium gossypii]